LLGFDDPTATVNDGDDIVISVLMVVQILKDFENGIGDGDEKIVMSRYLNYSERI
jgi:hypothetical protein